MNNKNVENTTKVGNEVLADVSHCVTGYVAMNKGEFDIENMSFYKTKHKAEKEWGKKQDIIKVQVIFKHGG